MGPWCFVVSQSVHNLTLGLRPGPFGSPGGPNYLALCPVRLRASPDAGHDDLSSKY